MDDLPFYLPRKREDTRAVARALVSWWSDNKGIPSLKVRVG